MLWTNGFENMSQNDYSVKGVYHLLIQREHPTHAPLSDIIWNKVGPHKASLFCVEIVE